MVAQYIYRVHIYIKITLSKKMHDLEQTFLDSQRTNVLETPLMDQQLPPAKDLDQSWSATGRTQELDNYMLTLHRARVREMVFIKGCVAAARQNRLALESELL